MEILIDLERVCAARLLDYNERQTATIMRCKQV